MKKNITEMSFDEIFPEAKPPSGSSFSSDTGNISFDDTTFGTDDDFTYNYDDYGSDISSIGSPDSQKNEYTDLSSDIMTGYSQPAAPQSSQGFSAAPVQYQAQSFHQTGTVQQNQGNYPYPEMVPGPELGNNNWQTTVNVYEPSAKFPGQQNAGSGSNSDFYSSQNRRNAGNKMPTPIILGLLSVLFSMMFPISLTLAIAGLVICNKETKKARETGTQPPASGGARILCIMGLIFSIISALPTVIGFLLPLFGVPVS